jgi:hypothetical protein
MPAQFAVWGLCRAGLRGYPATGFAGCGAAREERRKDKERKGKWRMRDVEFHIPGFGKTTGRVPALYACS